MEQELSAYNDDRTRQLTLLVEKQRRELAQIDAEITHLGINLADLVDSMQDIHLFPTVATTTTSTDTPQHSRASMISLSPSISSTALLSNSSNGNGTSEHN